MAHHNDIGDRGEALAVKFLENKGCIILEKNWRYSKAEIDIIAKEDEVLIFVEVKTRTSDIYGMPAEFVSRKKEELMVSAASRYMEKTGHDWEIRFDIISVLLSDVNNPLIRHDEDAFFPGLR